MLYLAIARPLGDALRFIRVLTLFYAGGMTLPGFAVFCVDVLA